MSNMKIKMKVTPEQSKQVQEICFVLGIFWAGGEEGINYLDNPYLGIKQDYLYYGDLPKYFEEAKEKEVSAEDFIKTKGFTISAEEPKPKSKKQDKQKTFKNPKKILKKFIKEITKRRQNKNFSDVVIYNECADILKDIVLDVCKSKKKAKED